MPKPIALLFIRLYQRFISPYKGFSCAYRAHTGRASCSALGYRAIRRFGVWPGIPILRKRLAKCGIAHRRCAHRRGPLQSQAGFCDLSCDLPCDFDFGSAACDILSNCDTGCDCGDCGSRKKREDEQEIHIPPHNGHGRSSGKG